MENGFGDRTAIIHHDDFNGIVTEISYNELLVQVSFGFTFFHELDNTDNQEDRNLSNVLLRHHETANAEFTSFEPVTPQFKGLKNWELNSLTLKTMDQKDNSITDSLGMTIVLHIR